MSSTLNPPKRGADRTQKVNRDEEKAEEISIVCFSLLCLFRGICISILFFSFQSFCLSIHSRSYSVRRTFVLFHSLFLYSFVLLIFSHSFEL